MTERDGREADLGEPLVPVLEGGVEDQEVFRGLEEHLERLPIAGFERVHERTVGLRDEWANIQKRRANS